VIALLALPAPSVSAVSSSLVQREATPPLDRVLAPLVLPASFAAWGPPLQLLVLMVKRRPPVLRHPRSVLTALLEASVKMVSLLNVAPVCIPLLERVFALAVPPGLSA